MHDNDNEAFGEPRATRRPPATRYFFVVLAVFYALVAIGGFAPEMYGSVDLAHPVAAYVHGGLMTAWLLLFIAQTGLAASGFLAWHRTLGLSALCLAPAIWISMGIVSVAQLGKFKSYDVLLLQWMVMVLFGLFSAWGIRVRRDHRSHKRLMTLATFILLQPALDRMSWLPEFNLPEYWSHAVWLYLLLAPLIVFDLVSTRRIHPTTLLGTALIVAAHTVVSLFWTTPGWLNFARTLTGAVPAMNGLP